MLCIVVFCYFVLLYFIIICYTVLNIDIDSEMGMGLRGCQHGVPEELIPDEGANLLSSVIQDICIAISSIPQSTWSRI